MAAVSRKRQADASPAERMKASLDNIVKDVRERTSRASLDVGRQSDRLHGALRLNSGWRALDAKSRERAGHQIDRFIERQQQHLQERWDRMSDFAEQLDEIAAQLADDHEAERDNAGADVDRLHRKQLSELADLAARTEESIASLMRLDDERLKDERSGIATVLATASLETIDAAFKRVDQDRSASWRMYLDLRRLEQDVDRAAEDIFWKPKPTRRQARSDRSQLDY